MKIGFFDQERIAGQEVLVSIEANLKSPESIPVELAQTVDYGSVLATVDRVLLGKEIKLIESAVLTLGRRLIQDFPLLDDLTLTIEKPVLPAGVSKGASVKIRERFTRIGS